jgi:hypothetical protein
MARSRGRQDGDARRFGDVHAREDPANSVSVVGGGLAIATIRRGTGGEPGDDRMPHRSRPIERPSKARLPSPTIASVAAWVSAMLSRRCIGSGVGSTNGRRLPS